MPTWHLLYKDQGSLPPWSLLDAMQQFFKITSDFGRGIYIFRYGEIKNSLLFSLVLSKREMKSILNKHYKGIFESTKGHDSVQVSI